MNSNKKTGAIIIIISLVAILLCVGVFLIAIYVFKDRKQESKNIAKPKIQKPKPKPKTTTVPVRKFLPLLQDNSITDIDGTFAFLKASDTDNILETNRKLILNDLDFMFEKKPSYKKYKLQIIEFNLAMYNFFVKGGRHLETKKKSQYYDNFTPDKLDTMESEHNYIQYIFPVMRFSDYQEEKVMVRTVARILVKRPVVLQTIQDFTVTFADFLIAKGKKEGNWFMHGNHNKNRISRVFMCCKLFGLEKQLTDFQYALTNILGYDYMNDDSSKRKYQKVLQTRRIN